MNHYDRVAATINLNHLLENVKNIEANIQKDTSIYAIIKADGYGHGAIPIAKELEAVSCVSGYGVATFEEAMVLIHSNIKKPILILGYTFPYCYDELCIHEIRPTVFRSDMLEELSEVAKKQQKEIRIHIKVDTGMSRIGIQTDDDGFLFVKKALATEGIIVEGIFTHFARADETDKSWVTEQINLFHQFISRIEKELHYKVPIKHCSNSAGIIELNHANMDRVRAGIILYGLWPSLEVAKNKVELKPVLELKSHIVHIKELEKNRQISYGGTYTITGKTRIATIPVGYGDGYPRSLSNKGWVLLNGKRANIIGRICMDQFMIDITNITDVKIGDEVVLIGKSGSQIITMEDLGEVSGRFNYELACDLGRRIPRVYLKDGVVIYTKDCFHDFT